LASGESITLQHASADRLLRCLAVDHGSADAGIGARIDAVADRIGRMEALVDVLWMLKRSA
jgi:hypothetical protein